MKSPTVVTNTTGTPGGLPSKDCSTRRPSVNGTGAGVSDAAGSISAGCPGPSQEIPCVMRIFFTGFRTHALIMER